MYLISDSYMQLFFYPFLLQKEPCLRWWNHSSMPLSRTLFRVVGQAQSCKSRYLSCEKRETLRSTRQSTKQFDLPSLVESCEKREMLCSTMRCWSRTTTLFLNNSSSWNVAVHLVESELWPRFIDRIDGGS